MGVKVGLVEYWNRRWSAEPFGLTVPLSVAPVAVTETAAPVVTVGGVRVVNEPVDAIGDGAEGLVATTRS